METNDKHESMETNDKHERLFVRCKVWKQMISTKDFLSDAKYGNK